MSIGTNGKSAIASISTDLMTSRNGNGAVDQPPAAVGSDAVIGRLDEFAMGAFGDQCAPANPRMPMLADLNGLIVAAYY